MDTTPLITFFTFEEVLSYLQEGSISYCGYDIDNLGVVKDRDFYYKVRDGVFQYYPQLNNVLYFANVNFTYVDKQEFIEYVKNLINNQAPTPSKNIYKLMLSKLIAVNISFFNDPTEKLLAFLYTELKSGNITKEQFTEGVEYLLDRG